MFVTVVFVQTRSSCPLAIYTMLLSRENLNRLSQIFINTNNKLWWNLNLALCLYIAQRSWSSTVSFHSVLHQLYMIANDDKSFLTWHVPLVLMMSTLNHCNVNGRLSFPFLKRITCVLKIGGVHRAVCDLCRFLRCFALNHALFSSGSGKIVELAIRALVRIQEKPIKYLTWEAQCLA